MKRNLSVALWTAFGVAVVGCTDEPSAKDGAETGACIEGECLGELECHSGLCVDPQWMPPGSTSGGATDSASSQGSGSDSGSDSDSGDETTSGGGELAPQVSVLFVIDNSGSMGEENLNLAASISIFMAALGDVDFRLGITTTDNGNPWCQGTGPEGGKLVLSSCRSRLQDFIFQGAIEIDSTAACTDFCSESTHSVLVGGTGQFPTLPTPTAEDPADASRPWVERVAGEVNLPSGIGLTEALQCLMPQGINGCGFESPLENMYKATTRMERDDEDSFGFAFEDGLFAVVFVTDEVDCSYNSDFQSIFFPDGMKTFWSLPEQQASPTSAVCWNAGVACSGSGTYEECHAANFDVAGNEVSDSAAEDGAVLRPVQRYLDQVGLRPTQVYGIVGVPMGYPTSDVQYQDSPGGTMNDPNYQINFGIGPGCTSTVAEAVPPVRIRELVEDDANRGALYSVCDTDYSPALESIAQDIADSLG